MKFDFKMMGNLCIYNGNTLAAVMAEGRAPDDAEEEDRTYTLALLRTWDGEKTVTHEHVFPVTVTGREIEMLHETLAFAAGVLTDVLEEVHDEDEVEEHQEALTLMARLLGG